MHVKISHIVTLLLESEDRLGIRLPSFEYQLHYMLAMWSEASYVISLCPIFLMLSHFNGYNNSNLLQSVGEDSSKTCEVHGLVSGT